MLRICGSTNRLCDGIHRRRFIEIGSMGLFGLSLAELLRSDAAAANAAGRSVRHPSNQSVLLIWQHGGPSQLDTFDMKPEAPAEVRGPYRPIRSSLAGLDVCELCPEQAKIMDKCTVIRSFSHANGDALLQGEDVLKLRIIPQQIYDRTFARSWIAKNVFHAFCFQHLQQSLFSGHQLGH